MPGRFEAAGTPLKVLWLVLRAGAIYLAAQYLLAQALALAGPSYARALIPVFSWELRLLLTDFRLDSISLIGDQDRRTADDSYIVKVWANEEMVVQGKTVNTRGWWLTLSLWAAPTWTPIAYIFAIILALPAMGLKQRAAAIALASPGVLLINMADLPLVVLAQLRSELYLKYAPTLAKHDLLDWWTTILYRNGRFALCVVVAIAAVAISRSISRSARARQASLPRSGAVPGT